MYYCLLCFYDEKCTGTFRIDYIFKDKKLALETLIRYNKFASIDRKTWMQIYFYDNYYIPNGDDRDYHVYLTPDKKIKIFLEKNNTIGNYRKLPLPPIEKAIPDESEFM